MKHEPHRAAARAYHKAVVLSGRVSIYELIDRAGVSYKTVLKHMQAGKLRGEKRLIGGKEVWTFSETATKRYAKMATALVDAARRSGGGRPVEAPPGYLSLDDVAARRGCSHWFVRDAIYAGRLAAIAGKHGKKLVREEDAASFIGPLVGGRERLSTITALVFYAFDRLGLTDADIAFMAGVTPATVRRWRINPSPLRKNAGRLLAAIRKRQIKVSITGDLVDLAKQHRADYMRQYMRQRRRSETAAEHQHRRQVDAERRTRVEKNG